MSDENKLPEGQSVEQRARELLAEQFSETDPRRGALVLGHNIGDPTLRRAIRAITAALSAQAPSEAVALSFDVLRSANVSRCMKWHPEGIGSWSPSDWLTAALGELGELAGEVKMHNRDRDGLAGNKEQVSPEERKVRMGKEAADVVIYLDLFCAERGINLGDAIVRKFNEVSERVGFPDRIELTAAPQARGVDHG